jgi:hypothetical protein
VSNYPAELDYENYSNIERKGGDYLKKRPIIITATNAITIPKKVRIRLILHTVDLMEIDVENTYLSLSNKLDFQGNI